MFCCEGEEQWFWWDSGYLSVEMRNLYILHRLEYFRGRLYWGLPAAWPSILKFTSSAPLVELPQWSGWMRLRVGLVNWQHQCQAQNPLLIRVMHWPEVTPSLKLEFVIIFKLVPLFWGDWGNTITKYQCLLLITESQALDFMLEIAVFVSMALRSTTSAASPVFVRCTCLGSLALMLESSIVDVVSPSPAPPE